MFQKSVVTVTGSPDGEINISTTSGDESLARYIGRVLENDVKTAKAAKDVRVGEGGSASKAMELDLQASKWENLVDANYYMDRDLKDYYLGLAVECRAEAARLRGETAAPWVVPKRTAAMAR